MPEYEHYYVVVPDSEFALGNVEHYPLLKSDHVLKNGEKQVLTQSEIAIWNVEES